MRNGKEVTRNSSEFKRINKPETRQEYKHQEYSDDEIEYHAGNYEIPL